jgi:hypothetical protein
METVSAPDNELLNYGPTTSQQRELTEVMAAFAGAQDSMERLARRAYEATKPWLAQRNAASEAGLTEPMEGEHFFDAMWSQANKVTDLACDAQIMFGPASRDDSQGFPDWYSRDDDPEHQSFDERRAQYEAEKAAEVEAEETAEPVEVDPLLRDRIAKLQTDAEKLEPQVRALAQDEVTVIRDLKWVTRDLDKPQATATWDAAGWHAATDATDLLNGHLRAMSDTHPTEGRYKELCGRRGIAPVKLWIPVIPENLDEL